LPLDYLHNEALISVQKIEIYEIVDLDPGNLLEYQVLRLSLEAFDPMEAQRNRRSVLVRIGIFAEKLRFTNIDGQLFLQFAAQGIRLAFAIFYFSSWKLPFQSKCGVLTTLANQHPAISKDQTSDNADRGLRRCLHLFDPLTNYTLQGSLREKPASAI